VTTIGRSITLKGMVVWLRRGLSLTLRSREEEVVCGQRVLTMAHEKRIIMF